MPPATGREGAIAIEDSDVTRLELGGRTIVLVGTAHVSRESSELVRRVIESERPDRVAVELDDARFRALTDRPRWESLDLRQLIRERQLPTLVLQLLLASYQKRLGAKLGVLPGAEMLEAARAAEALGIPVERCDRNVRTTLLRAWRSLSWWKRNLLVSGLLASAFDRETLSEEELRRLRSRDVLSELMADLARQMPVLKRVLIDERDAYLAERIRACEGRRIVAVVGAGHVEGIGRALAEGSRPDLAALETIPVPHPAWKLAGWVVPAAILGALVWLGVTRGGSVAGEKFLFWALATGLPSGLGALAAAGHPMTILSALVAAPITTLHPLLGAGYVTALVQAWACPPRVADFERVGDDASRPLAWWRNRLLRVVLAFVFPTIGAIVGVYVGGIEILRSLV